MNSSAIIPHSRPHLEDQEIAAVVQALRAGHLAQGAEVARLESDLSKMFKGSEVVAVSSGTAALYLALAALGVSPGKKVIIPSYTCGALYAAVAHAGGTPLCADTGKDTVCLTPDTVNPLLARQASRGTNAVSAIIVPHSFGFLADLEGLQALGLPIIEDCAQAVGGRYAVGALAGSKGLISILSFYGTKLLPAGEGGACLTRQKELAETIRRLRNCDERPLHSQAFNFKLSDIHAALARAQLPSLSKRIKRRAAIAERYDSAFGQASFRKKRGQSQAVCFRYLVETTGAIERFLQQALERGIICRRPVWRPLHHQFGGRCPQSERLQDTLVSIPIYPSLTAEEVETICATLPGLLA